jgi:GT2 family glycosyltransferase
MLVSVIIPNYNGLEYLGPCLTSVLDQDIGGDDLEILLVDNGSTDASVADIRKQFPTVRCEVLATNTGFTGAINHGANAARGELLLFLNNDTVMRPGALLRMLAALRTASSDVAGVQPLLLWARDPRLVDSTGIAVNGKLGARDDWAGFSVEQSDTQSREIWGTCFACVLMRRECFVQCGGLDESYFAEWDDVDFCLRARWFGWRFLLTAEAEVLHHRSPTLKTMPDARYVRLRRNQLWTYIKALPAGMLVTRLLYRLQHDLFQLPHYIRKRQVSRVAEFWREAWKGRRMMMQRRRELMARARLTPREMRLQLRCFMTEGGAAQRRQRTLLRNQDGSKD